MDTGVSQLNSGAVVVEGVAYVMTGLLGAGGLLAVDATTGQESWRKPLPEQPFGSTLAVADGVAYAAGLQGSLTAMDLATGAERWRAQLGAPCTSSPLVVDGLVVIGANDDRYTAFDASTGEERWDVALGDGGDYTISPSAAAAGGIVYLTTLGQDEDGSLRATEAATGDDLWEFESDEPGLATPAVAGGVVYGGGEGGDVYALDAVDGEERWRVRAGKVLSAPAVAGDAVFVHAEDALVALDAATGTERWRLEVGGVWSAPAVANRVVCVGGHGRPALAGLFAVDAVSGALRWRVPALDATVAVPAVAGDAILVGDADGGLVAIAGTDAAGAGSGSATTGALATPIVFSTQVDEAGLLLDPGTAFPAETPALHAGFDVIGVTAGVPVHVTWLLDGAVLAERDGAWENGSAGHASENLAANTGNLTPGRCEVVVALGGEEIRRGGATVGWVRTRW